MEDEQKTERFSVALTPSELKRLDDWAWERRIRSRSDAIRQLIERGYTAPEQDAEPEPEPPKKRRK